MPETKSVEERKLPEEVQHMLNYLEASGTGDSKLVALRALALRCNDLNEFMLRMDKVAPAGTVEKAKKYLEQLPAVKEAMAAPLAQEITTTTKTEVITETVSVPTKPGKVGKDKPGAVGTASTPDEEPSEVADLNVTDAKEAIARMRSVEKLQHIAANDNRASVQKAATDRLTELQSPPTS